MTLLAVLAIVCLPMTAWIVGRQNGRNLAAVLKHQQDTQVVGGLPVDQAATKQKADLAVLDLEMRAKQVHLNQLSARFEDAQRNAALRTHRPMLTNPHD